MRRNFISHILLSFNLLGVLLLFSACHITKFVPEDKSLLYKVHIKLDDNSAVKESDLLPYVRQKQNTEIFGFWKLQLHIYNTAPIDTTTKARKRNAKNARKVGEAPEIYNPNLTAASINQLRQAMQNLGYFNATVDTALRIKNRKARLTYYIHTGEQYHINNYSAFFKQPDLNRYANVRYRLIKNGTAFNASVLNEERARISDAMRRNGYYYFEKNFLDYTADSAFNNNQVELMMKTSDLFDNLNDTLRRQVFSKCYISNIHFHQNYNPFQNNGGTKIITTQKNDYFFSYEGKRFLRNNMLRKRVLIKPHTQYNALLLEKTYSRFNRLGAIKFTDIAFLPTTPDSLECHITLTKAKLNTVSAEIEGTYTANDWGIAAGAGYANKNIFGGAEVLSLNGRGSYEWRQGGGKAIGLQGNVGLLFPNSFKIDFLYDYQSRPDEYERNISNTSLSYTVQKLRSNWIHTFRFIEINYVYLPWISSYFRDSVIARSNTLKHTYENHFIVNLAYSGSFTTQKTYLPYHNYVQFNYNIEIAGNTLYAIAKYARFKQDSLGAYLVADIPFSQYVKGDIDVSYHHYLQPKHQFVYHIGAGIAIPYLNSSAIPFERRYYSGGSRVRGWKARQLGPGSFDGKDEIDLNSGDIRLDMNIEYRWNFWNKFELALFTDAGNVWTIKDYVEQPGGQFRWNRFYKQLAWGYGAGLRYNFNIIIFTFDLGIKLHDPGLINAGKQWRTAANGLNLRDDFYLNFGIGYPF